MSCEVICCEVPEILHALIEEFNGKYLDRLFSFLELTGELDCYLAGYFEKILEMLFRKMTSRMMYYFNSKSIGLLKLFLIHVNNYSIMQIIQRLMLPHLPFTQPSENDIFDEITRDQDYCNWSFLSETCELLLQTMLTSNHIDVPLHISDMLITILQLSPPDTLLIKYLCTPDHLHELIIRSTMISSYDLTQQPLPLDLQIQSNISLACISVLESLISRLFESGYHYQLNEIQTEIPESDQLLIKAIQYQLHQLNNDILPHISKFKDILQYIIQHAKETKLIFPSKIASCKLGHNALQMIKLIESIARVGHEDMDQTFCDYGIFADCMEIFFLFENNSILHLSIQRIFENIFESPHRR